MDISQGYLVKFKWKTYVIVGLISLIIGIWATLINYFTFHVILPSPYSDITGLEGGVMVVMFLSFLIAFIDWILFISLLIYLPFLYFDHQVVKSGTVWKNFHKTVLTWEEISGFRVLVIDKKVNTGRGMNYTAGMDTLRIVDKDKKILADILFKNLRKESESFIPLMTEEWKKHHPNEEMIELKNYWER